MWVLGYNVTPRVLLLFLGKPGLLVVPRIGGTDVHLGEVLLEPDHLHGEVLGLVPLPGVGLLVLHSVLHVHGVPLLVAELQFGEAQGWNLPRRVELVLDLKLLSLLDRHFFVSA